MASLGVAEVLHLVQLVLEAVGPVFLKVLLQLLQLVLRAVWPEFL